MIGNRLPGPRLHAIAGDLRASQQKGVTRQALHHFLDSGKTSLAGAGPAESRVLPSPINPTLQMGTAADSSNHRKLLVFAPKL